MVLVIADQLKTWQDFTTQFDADDLRFQSTRLVFISAFFVTSAIIMLCLGMVGASINITLGLALGTGLMIAACLAAFYYKTFDYILPDNIKAHAAEPSKVKIAGLCWNVFCVGLLFLAVVIAC